MTATTHTPLVWNSDTDYAINLQLLEGGKALMKKIYTFDTKEKDYFPESYSVNKQTSSLTTYSHHVSNPTSIFWQDAPLAWACENKDGKGYIEKVDDKSEATNPSKDGYLCKTDCSGFITGLFAYCNTVGKETTQFTAWQKNDVIYEASDFFTHIAKSTEFKHITDIHDVTPGDLITFEYPPGRAHSDTGHIMLVVAVAQSGDSVQVVVMDESTSRHGEDTRTSAFEGLGMGYSTLFLEDNEIRFRWAPAIGSTVEYPVMIGRAL